MKKIMWRAWSLTQQVKALARKEEGQGMVEYGLILALIAVVVIIILTAMGGKLQTLFGTVNSAL